HPGPAKPTGFEPNSECPEIRLGIVREFTKIRILNIRSPFPGSGNAFLGDVECITWQERGVHQACTAIAERPISPGGPGTLFLSCHIMFAPASASPRTLHSRPARFPLGRLPCRMTSARNRARRTSWQTPPCILSDVDVVSATSPYRSLCSFFFFTNFVGLFSPTGLDSSMWPAEQVTCRRLNFYSAHTIQLTRCGVFHLYAKMAGPQTRRSRSQYDSTAVSAAVDAMLEIRCSAGTPDSLSLDFISRKVNTVPPKFGRSSNRKWSRRLPRASLPTSASVNGVKKTKRTVTTITR
ncbi:hypothetical protein C8R45DRAFT_1179158, partial [Mycena sanguinolenta]